MFCLTMASLEGVCSTAVTGGTCVVRRLNARPQHVLLFADREMSNGISIAGQRHACRQNNRQLSESTTYCIVLTTRVCAEGKGTFIFSGLCNLVHPIIDGLYRACFLRQGRSRNCKSYRMFNDTRSPIIVVNFV